MNLKLRKYTFLLLLPLVLFVLKACQKEGEKNKETKIIRIDFEQDTIGGVTIEDIVTFESTPEAIFGHVSRISFAVGKIFILDNRNRDALFVFDDEGQFLHKTETGKGPGECLKPIDYYIDQNKYTIQVFDQMLQKFITYDLDLKYQNSLPSPRTLYFKWFDKIENDKWLVLQQSRLKITDTNFFSYLIYSSDFENVTDSLLPDPILSNEKLSMFNPISRENSEKFFCRPFDQHLYIIENGEAKARYYLDFGSYNILQTDKEKEYEYVYQLSRNGERVTLLGDLMNSDRYIGVSFVLRRKPHFLIYSKLTDKTMCSIPLTGLPYGVLKGMTNDSTFILMVEPQVFLQYAEEKALDSRKYEGLSDNGNDVMILFSLRE